MRPHPPISTGQPPQAAQHRLLPPRTNGSWVCLVLMLLLGACATVREDLNRGQRFYEENQYERALSIFRALERDLNSLNQANRARYAYLRGMTDYRLGFRPHARHWLAIAQAIEAKYPGGLDPDWKERMAESLEQLNREVYGGQPLQGTSGQGKAGGSSEP